MQKITIELYEYDELNKKAQERALSDWNEHNDDPFMQSHMINLLKEKLEERSIKYDTDTINVYYSLALCQGDGFMFEGLLTWKKKWSVRINHSGHYYHSNSKTVEIWETAKDNLDHSDNIVPEAVAESFEEMYQAVCKEMEQIGYDHIEYTQSEESFREVCEANGYTFEKNGKMRNV